MADPHSAPEGIDTTVPNAARIYDYGLGGKNNFAVDRETAEAGWKRFPEGPLEMRRNRDFLIRAVRYLAAEAGIRQFLDIGSGLPTQQNVHEVAQEVAPDARVVYVDYDPVVVRHGEALLASTERVRVIRGDLRDPDGILGHETVRESIDFTRPVAVLMVAVLHFIRDEERPHDAVARYREAIPSGGYLALSHMLPPTAEEAEFIAKLTKNASAPYVARSREDVARFFDGLELVEPGLVAPAEWRQPIAGGAQQGSRWAIAGVARKP